MQRTRPSGIESPNRPRIGIPYRQASEEQEKKYEKIQPYLEAVKLAGGEPKLLSLFQSKEDLLREASELDGIVLPGSPADVNPANYGEAKRPETAAADPWRERTDQALLDWAFAKGKPVLAICYGMQLLNVYCGGTLVQDIAAELPASLTHRWDRTGGAPEPHHPARLAAGSVVGRLAEGAQAVVNSSHHQSIREPGRNLRVTATAPDGVIEAVEFQDPARWVIGVQWHPERQAMAEGGGRDAGTRLARALFVELVRAAGRLPGNAARVQNEAEER